MVSKKTDLDAGIERLYRGPLDAFTSARNDLVKQLRKLGSKEDALRVQGLPKPAPSAWAVNVLFERESERMDALLAAGERARAGQREAVSGRGVEALRASLGEVRGLIDELRRRGAALLAESGRAVSREVIERIGTDLQALALSPDAEAAASRRWLDQDLDPPGFEVLAGLQLAGAPVVDLAARRAEPEEKRPARESKDGEEPERRETVERARREREEERRRRRIEVAEEKAQRARDEAESLRGEAETAETAAAEARRRAEAAEQAAHRARDKADRAAERLARAETEVKEAKAER